MARLRSRVRSRYARSPIRRIAGASPGLEFLCGTFAKSAASNVISGLAFAPLFVRVIVTAQTAFGAWAADAIFSVGFSDGTTDFCVSGSSQDNVAPAVSKQRHANAICTILDNAGTVIDEGTCTFSASSVTITWSMALATAVICQYEIWGGGDLTNVKVGTFTAATGTAPYDQAVTGVGFNNADAVLFLSTGKDGSAPPHNGPNTGIVFGWGLAGGGDQCYSNLCCEDNVNDHDTQSSSFGGSIGGGNGCIVGLNIKLGIPITNGAAYLKDTTGTGQFTLTWFQAPAGGYIIGYAALKGPTFYAGQDSTPTSTGNQTVGPGSGQTPKALIMQASYINAAQSASHSDGRFDGTHASSIVFLDKDNPGGVNPTQADMRQSNLGFNIGTEVAGTPTVKAGATFVGFGAGAATINWGSVDVSPIPFVWLLVADAVTGPPGLPNLGTPAQGVPARPVDRTARLDPSIMRAPEGRGLRQLQEIERDFDKSTRAEREARHGRRRTNNRRAARRAHPGACRARPAYGQRDPASGERTRRDAPAHGRAGRHDQVALALVR